MTDYNDLPNNVGAILQKIGFSGTLKFINSSIMI